jgi:hypothetical protein
MPARIGTAFLGALLAVGAATGAHAAESALLGHWSLNHALTLEVRPPDPKQRDVLGNLPRTNVSVGGIPLPIPGSGQPPPVAGSARDPAILHSASLTIEPAGEALRLVYDGGHSDTLKPGNDQGLVSRWSRRKLTSRYETTSRKVSQVYEVRSDGRLLVTVKLNPDQGPTLVHKRVFDPVDP